MSSASRTDRSFPAIPPRLYLIETDDRWTLYKLTHATAAVERLQSLRTGLEQSMRTLRKRMKDKVDSDAQLAREVARREEKRERTLLLGRNLSPSLLDPHESKRRKIS